MFCLLKKARSLLLPIDMQIEMFEKTVKPILLYGCEVIGTGNINILEQVQLNFLKYILNLKKSTPNYNFILNNEAIEIVKEFKYLGILFSRSGSFLAAKSILPLKLLVRCFVF